MQDLEALRTSIVLSDATANTKIIGEYTVLNESDLIHCIIGLRFHPSRETDTIHFFRFKKKTMAKIWELDNTEVVEDLPGRIVFPSL